MAMSSSERLRLRMSATTKIIAPTPIKDSSLLTAVKRYKNTVIPTQKQSDGQQLTYSSEIVGAARAGCAICATPRVPLDPIACCPLQDPDPATKPVALQGKLGCCLYYGGPPPSPECCRTPGNVNTWWANDIPAGYVGTLPLCHPCPPPEPSPPLPPCTEC